MAILSGDMSRGRFDSAMAYIRRPWRIRSGAGASAARWWPVTNRVGVRTHWPPSIFFGRGVIQTESGATCTPRSRPAGLLTRKWRHEKAWSQ